MRDPSPEEESLIKAAKEILRQQGIQGICLDTLKDTSGTKEERIDRLVTDTIYWNG